MPFATLLTQDRIDRHTRDGYWVNRTITDYLDEAAAATPGKVAFVDSRRQVTYAQLRQEVDRCALGLLELGVQPGDVVSTSGAPRSCTTCSPRPTSTSTTSPRSRGSAAWAPRSRGRWCARRGPSCRAEHANPNGGGIALGHPLGASGARLALTAALELHDRGARRALATMCIGVGQGIAVLLETV